MKLYDFLYHPKKPEDTEDQSAEDYLTEAVGLKDTETDQLKWMYLL